MQAGNPWLRSIDLAAAVFLFAHITLLSGVKVRNHDTNALLMTEKRDTLVTAFKNTVTGPSP